MNRSAVPKSISGKIPFSGIRMSVVTEGPGGVGGGGWWCVDGRAGVKEVGPDGPDLQPSERLAGLDPPKNTPKLKMSIICWGQMTFVRP